MIKPLFSVIVPTYNRPATLQRTLECLEAQDCGFNFEVIVVDDYPVNVLPELGFGQDRRQHWKLIRNGRNLGRAATRNVGIRAARGEYILFLDDDIWAEPQLLQAHFDNQQEIGGGVVVGAVPISDEVPHDVWNDHYRRWVASLHRRMEGIKDDLTYHYFFTGNVSLLRSTIEAAGLFDEGFKGYSCEDTELGYRLKKSGVKMVHQPAAVGWHYNTETLDSILNKKKHWGGSAGYFVQKHPELAEEMSVAGLLAPGNSGYQDFLNPAFLWLGKTLCRGLAGFGLTSLCLKLLPMVQNAYYAYGMKKSMGQAR